MFNSMPALFTNRFDFNYSYSRMSQLNEVKALHVFLMQQRRMKQRLNKPPGCVKKAAGEVDRKKWSTLLKKKPETAGTEQHTNWEIEAELFLAPQNQSADHL
jgi:hypothetical protein